MESQEFRDQLQPFLFNNTSRFIRELLSFARSPYDMRAYDENVVYDMPSNTSSQTRQESASKSFFLYSLVILNHVFNCHVQSSITTGAK